MKMALHPTAFFSSRPHKGVAPPWRAPNPLRFSVGFGALGDIGRAA